MQEEPVVEKDLICLKTLRLMGEIHVPNTASEFRAWKVSMMPYIGTFDGSGALRQLISQAMKARGAAQEKLKFETTPYEIL